MILPEFRCLFVHIPKTGGQSITRFLFDQAGLPWKERQQKLIGPNDNPGRGPPQLTHLMAHEYLQLGYLDIRHFQQWFKFSFVRNPWDRLVSEYVYSHLGRYSFEQFLMKHFPTPENDCYKSHADDYRHVIPQHQFLFDNEGRQLVDFIGRFEHLDEDFKHVANQLGIKGEIHLPRKNSAKRQFRRLLEKNGLTGNKGRITSFRRPEYRAFYNQESHDFVAKYYAQDIKRFGYDFD
jgi:hypothetical protein